MQFAVLFNVFVFRRNGHRVVAGLLLQWMILSGQFSSTVYGDLYSHGVLTLDWLVDSSDEILLVRYSKPETAELVTELRETLKTKNGEAPVGTSDSASLRGTQAGEWILFLRYMKDGSRRVVRRINLEHPRDSFRTAAFTRTGELIYKTEDVLKAVRARVRVARRLPANCDPFAVDKLIELAQTNGQRSGFEDTSPIGDPPPVEQYLGGKLVGIGMDWSNDIWLCVAVVPVEPEDHDDLLNAAASAIKPTARPKLCHPIACLINFPGKKTEECLREIMLDKNRRDSRQWRARNVLNYLQYRSPVTDPLNGKLVGSWQLDGRTETIKIDLAADSTFQAKGYAALGGRGKLSDNPTWTGAGFWVVRDGQLSILRSHALGVRNRRTIFQDKPIKDVQSQEVVLEGGPPMRRID